MPHPLRNTPLCFAFVLSVSMFGLSSPAVLAGENESLEPGRQLYLEGTQPQCGVCHTLEEAGTSGGIGPNLDNLQPTEEAVRAAVRDGVGVMPAFSDSLSQEEIEAIANYVVSVTQD